MDNVQKTILIGFGTGRCGTTTLSKILTLQKCCRMLHESRPLLPWIKDMGLLKFKIQQLAESNGRFIGDIGMYYLPYIEDLMSIGLNIKFIYLERPVEETVTSFLLKTEGRNHWVYHTGENYKLDPEWDPCFPKYPNFTKEEAVRQYVIDYHIKADNLIKKFPSRIHKMMTDNLNDHLEIKKMLEFCGFDESEILIETFHSNKIQKKQNQWSIERVRSIIGRLLYFKD